MPQMSAADVAQRLERPANDGVSVIDVRERAEWESGHIAGALNIPLGYLAEHVSELERGRPLVLHCQSGGRSAVGASLLRSLGFTNVFNLSDGFTGWQRRGFPVERPAPAEEPAPPPRPRASGSVSAGSAAAGGSSST
jgi:hydroxyacylglutathione hydrolase